jgi:hypothetical protein
MQTPDGQPELTVTIATNDGWEVIRKAYEPVRPQTVGLAFSAVPEGALPRSTDLFCWPVDEAIGSIKGQLLVPSLVARVPRIPDQTRG